MKSLMPILILEDNPRDAELIIHNAPFDVAFLNAELRRLAPAGQAAPSVASLCRVLDTLPLARQMQDVG